MSCDRSDTVIVYFWAFIERRGSLSTGRKVVVIVAEGEKIQVKAAVSTYCVREHSEPWTSAQAIRCNAQSQKQVDMVLKE